MKIVLSVGLVFAVGLAAACTDRPASTRSSDSGASTTEGTPASADVVNRSITVLGGLTVTIEMNAAEVEPGSWLEAAATYENSTNKPVTVVDCELAEGATGIVSADDSDPDLGPAPVVDCGGEEVVSPGESGQFAVSFPALAGTKPLAPGRYVAAYRLDGELIRIPVTVVTPR